MLLASCTNRNAAVIGASSYADANDETAVAELI